jgi:hypothetical protein
MSLKKMLECLCIIMNANFSHKDYREANKDKISKYNKNYREANKDKISIYRAKWYKSKPEYNNDYYKNNNEYFKDYYQVNKEKINTKYICECGGRYSHSSKARHDKTQKHQKWLTQVASLDAQKTDSDYNQTHNKN